MFSQYFYYKSSHCCNDLEENNSKFPYYNPAYDGAPPYKLSYERFSGSEDNYSPTKHQLKFGPIKLFRL